MDNLIESIKREQDKRQLSNSKLAQLLGIDVSTWSRIKRELRQPGGKFLRAVAKNFPELHDSMLIYLSNPTDNRNAPQKHQDGILGVLRGWLRVRYLGLKKILRRNKANSDMKSKKPRNSVIKI